MTSRKQPDDNSVRCKRLSLSPLTLDAALAGAMATGNPSESRNKRAKRTATKRRPLTKRDKQAWKAGQRDG